MTRDRVARGLGVLVALAAAACADTAKLPVSAGYGPDPALPEPDPSLVPTISVAPARGWQGGEEPAPAPGFEVEAFGRGLEHPRWLYVLRNGDVLVAETNAPPMEAHGLRGVLMKRVMKRAGGDVPSANRITLLRDADRDGTPELRSVFLEGLHSPFGMALVDGDLYVANTDDGNARGRPVGVAIDRAGALLVADDVGNVVWRVTPRRAGRLSPASSLVALRG